MVGDAWIPPSPLTIVVAAMRGRSCGASMCAWAAGVGDLIGWGIKAPAGDCIVRGEARRGMEEEDRGTRENGFKVISISPEEFFTYKMVSLNVHPYKVSRIDVLKNSRRLC